MRRRTGVLLLALCSCVLALTASPPGGGARATAPTPAQAQGQGRPNIVLFLTDDMRKDDLAHMPHVRRVLQRRGTTFSNAFSPTALCCPARATLLTGLHAHNHRTMGNLPEHQGGWSRFRRYNDVRNLLPRWMQRRGYRTFHVGKYLNGFAGGAQPGWDYWQVPFRRIYDYRRWASVVKRPGLPARTVRYLDGRDYQETVVRDTVRRYVRRWSPGRRPFFMWVGALAPHNAVIDDVPVPPVPERKYRDLPVPPRARTVAFNEEDISDKPAWVRWLSPKSPSRMATLHRARIRALRSVDDTVARTVRTLRRQGELDQTILIFTSDNGFLLGEHRMSGKSVAYQEAVRVPLLIRGPGFRPGAVATQPVSLVDVSATIAATAGVRVRRLDGVPLKGFDDDPARHRDRPVLIEGSPSEIPRGHGLATDRFGRFYWGAVTGDWTYVRYAAQPGPDMRGEFYDRAQPGGDLQVDNSWDPDAAASSPQRRLERWVAAHRDCAGAVCQQPLGP